jgi:cell division protein FtsL
LFAAFYAISMLNMQANQILKISKYVDTGEISKLNHLASKDMKITQGLLYLSFIISFCCLFLIIIYLYISLLHARKTKNNITHKD